jgi:hypothetical protein
MQTRPILALTPPVGPTADVATQLGYPAIEPGNVSAIVAALEDLLERHATAPLPPSATAAACAERYGLDPTARAFSAVLDEASS